MKKLTLLTILFICYACNPCKYVAKHAECFPADSVITDNSQQYYDSTYYTEIDSFRIVLAKLSKDTACKKDVELLLKQLSNANGRITELKIQNENDKTILTGKLNQKVNVKKEIIIQKEYVKLVNPVNVENEKKLKAAEAKDKENKAKIKAKNKTIIILSLVIVLIVAGGLLLKKLKIL